MAKKKFGGGKSKNPELRGGKNTLPKDASGKVDVKKVAKVGAQEKKKKWVDKKVVKNRPEPNNPTKSKTSSLPATKKNIPLKAINKLKVKAQTPLAKNTSKQQSVKPVNANGRSKLTVFAKLATVKNMKTNEFPKKMGKLPVKGINKLNVKAQTLVNKPLPKKAPAKGK